MKKITLFVFLNLLFSSLTFSQVFDISDATTTDNTSGSNPKTVVETLMGITMTARIQNQNTSNPDITDYLDTASLNGVIGTSDGAVFNASSSEVGVMSIEFNVPVTVASLRMGSTQTTESRTWTLTPTGGSNTVVTKTSTFNGNVEDILLEWSDITRIEITSNATGSEQFVLDAVLLGVATNNPPSILLAGPSTLSVSSATLNATVTNDGGDTITERGFVYALTSDDPTPSVAESTGANVFKEIVAGTTGEYNQLISGLMASSEYSFIAYAINAEGTSESSVDTFETLSTVTDCTSINNFDISNTGNNNLHLGQSFVACQTGILKSIDLLVTFGETSSGETINVYSGSTITPANLLGSVTNQEFTENGGDPNNFDSTDFSAQNINIMEGQTYTFDVPTSANLIFTEDNGYLNGSLYLNGADQGGNFDLVFKVTIFNSSLSNDSLNLNEQLTINPNPVKSTFQIETLQTTPLSIIIYDILGKVVYQNNIGQRSFDISHLKSGYYLLKINSERGPIVKRIVKE